MTNQDVGIMILRRRLDKGMSQADLGEKVGKDARTIRSYENGTIDIKVSTLSKIAEALGTDLKELLFGKDEKEPVEIRVYQLEERLDMAKILIKNGYTVSHVKRSNGDGKTVQYRLRIEESDSNLRITK